MKYFQVFLTAICLLGLGCRIDDATVSSGPLVLGAIYNLTGGQSSLDIPSSKGAQLAIDQINSNGGIDGRTIQLIQKDGQTRLDVLKTTVMDVLNEHPTVIAFLGLSDTDQVLSAATAAAGSGRVFLTSGATSPQLPGQVPDYLYLACFGDNVQAAAAAEWAYNERGFRTVSVVYDSVDTYTRLLQGYFISRFEEMGGQVKSGKGYIEGNPAPAIQGIQPADFIFFSALPQDAPMGVQLIRQAGFTVPIIGGDAYDEPAAWADLPDIEEVFFTTHAYLGADNPSSKVQAFREAYIQVNKEEPSAFAALGYDAARLLAEALEKAESADPEAVRQALASIRDFDGITGSITYGPDSRIPQKGVTIMEVRDGIQKLVVELVPEKVPAP